MVSRLASATQRLIAHVEHLKDVPVRSRVSHHLAAVLGRDDLPRRSDFASLRPGLRLQILSLAATVSLIAFIAVGSILWVEASTISAPAWFGARASRPGGSKASVRPEHVNILQRPLFSRSRRPLAVAQPIRTPSLPAAPAQDRSIALKGIFLDGKIAKAFLSSTEFPLGTWVNLNGEIGGWHVTSIAPDLITLNANDQKRVIALYGGSAPR